MRELIERLLHLPPAPEPPPGDEATSRVFRAAPKYLKYQLVIWFILSAFLLVWVCIPILVVMIAISAGSGHRHSSQTGVILAGIAGCFVLSVLGFFRLLSFLVIRLDYERRWYLVTDRSLRIREGVWVVREMTITFANIQNLAISQGPIQRALGLFDLRVETAGGGGGGPHSGKGGPGLNLHAACFRGIDNAAEVKELIQQRLKALKDSGLGDHEEREHPVAADSSASFLEALRAVHSEARALRSAAAE